MDSQMENSVIRVDEGLTVERVCTSQANVFVNDYLYDLYDDELRDLSYAVADRSRNAVTMFLGGVPRGCIVLVWNPTKGKPVVFAEAVQYVCRAIVRMRHNNSW